MGNEHSQHGSDDDDDGHDHGHGHSHAHAHDLSGHMIGLGAGGEVPAPFAAAFAQLAGQLLGTNNDDAMNMLAEASQSLGVLQQQFGVGGDGDGGGGG
eukprot:CAMPEP_0198325732 /NCGR_PEP_ID=MMETSP1450-20131203/13409_1 /TAXON_ID=753684 ORGANISM="Madagascaria erythrocladiodes, Strain CCMP3234" /NCGR_SAMPLE_ID=MMETSP1450 /ASSEMBLY_ACC=CAM_ASM_001115 /LENGTH=97 /DNA_ID=CAMNT_0044029647 /DNA_START=119 /DNA_END=408 /DNA_ORIENTATION=-